MNANWLNHVLEDAAAVARLYKHHDVADDVERARDHYRKLAEREKALTEALKELESAFCDIAEYEFGPTYEDHYAIIQARAALALHKEDA